MKQQKNTDASKNIIRKDFDTLSRKKNIDILDCQNFTKMYLKRDEYTLFTRKFMNNVYTQTNRIIKKHVNKLRN